MPSPEKGHDAGADRVSGEVKRLLANLPRARFLPAPDGSVTIFRDDVLTADQRAADEFVISAGGSIEEAPAHDQPVMSAIPSGTDLAGGEKYYVIPATALEGAPGE